LSVHIFALRKALGEADDGQSYIETVPRQGYRFTANVREVNANGTELVVERHTLSRVTVEEQEISAEGDGAKVHSALLRGANAPPLLVPASSIETGGLKRASHWRQKRVALIALAVLLGLTGVFAYRWMSNEATPPQTSAEVKSMAVLPFRTLGAGADDEYLGLGLADTLITQFGQTRQLVVRPTSAVRKYAEAEHDPLAIGRALRVEAVLEGSTQKAGERLRVTARLLRVSDGASLWAGKFDEKMTDIFAVQDSISRQVAQALVSNFGAAEQNALARRTTKNVEAYQHYLKGRYFWGRRTTEDLQKAVQYFEQAIQVDPQYARAYSGLADCYLTLSEFNVMPREEAYAKAIAAAEKAISIDPALAEAHTTLAFLHLSRDWDYLNAERKFKQAIELDPNYATACQFYGVYLLAVGQTEAGVAETRRALEIDPLSIQNNSQLGRALYFARRYDEAIAQCLKTLELDSNSAAAHVYLGQAYEQ